MIFVMSRGHYKKAVVFNKPGQRNIYARVPTLRMNNKRIAVVRDLKYLGIILDHRLLWNKHIQHITEHTGFIMHEFAKVARSTWGLGGMAMSAIYDSIFIPVLTYGCGTWGAAVKKEHPRQKLTSAQRRALLLITKAYRTTPTASLQVLARKPPIDKYITHVQRIWKIKCGFHLATLSNVFDAESWEENIPFKCTLSPYTKSKFNEISPTNCAIIIYTDGSKCENHVGASFVVYRNDVEIYYNVFRLGAFCNVLQAELFAILKAIDWCEGVVNNAKIAIVTDSLSSLTMLRKESTHPLAFTILPTLIDSDNEYYFSWKKSLQSGNKDSCERITDATLRRKLLEPTKFTRRMEGNLRFLKESDLSNHQVKQDRRRPGGRWSDQRALQN
ncbi:uncharacterized protein LOC111627071 [Centruroides sculpturatus]|uniref:uncharacterized protein LOC111627071 n=1 Tax=Centruroides sculpturatus TaxID=218467 RepID=UPI000C6E14BA|nr:uncharacterized protein LOC111627071 [Centruroides sculpturatus]